MIQRVFSTLFQIYKFFWNLLLATSITSTVLANVLQIWGKRQLNNSKGVFDTILEWMMYISGNTTILGRMMYISGIFFMVKRIFWYVFAGLVRPLQALGASRCPPKKRIGSNRDIVLVEHIFDQVKLIFIVLLVGLI